MLKNPMQQSNPRLDPARRGRRWLLPALICTLACGLLSAVGSHTESAGGKTPRLRRCPLPTAARSIGHNDQRILLCQALSPAAPYPICGVDGVASGVAVPRWGDKRPLDWQPYAQGEYAGHARLAHVHEYRLRADDQLELVFRMTREETEGPYELNIGDEVRIESAADQTLNRDLIIQPDGTLTLRMVGQVMAMRRTVTQLTEEIEQLYQKYYKFPAITVTPLRVNTKLEDLRATVDKRFGFGGQSRTARVTPEGTIALPAIGSVPAQGLTLGELKMELDQRFAAEVQGLEVTPVLLARAPRYVYVVGVVRTPGRFEMVGPTTLTQAIALAGGWNVGANLRQVVIFRRGDDWRLLATMLDIRGALYGKYPIPADELWLNDSDIIVVPKAPLRVFDDYVSLIFTQGLWAVVPFSQSVSISMLGAWRLSGSPIAVIHAANVVAPGAGLIAEAVAHGPQKAELHGAPHARAFANVVQPQYDHPRVRRGEDYGQPTSIGSRARGAEHHAQPQRAPIRQGQQPDDIHELSGRHEQHEADPSRRLSSPEMHHCRPTRHQGQHHQHAGQQIHHLQPRALGLIPASDFLRIGWANPPAARRRVSLNRRHRRWSGIRRSSLKGSSHRHTGAGDGDSGRRHARITGDCGWPGRASWWSGRRRGSRRRQYGSRRDRWCRRRD
jgi:polysaccharide export outer membrane protein